MNIKRNLNNGLFLVLCFLALILINVVSHFYRFRLDLTADKRHTLSEATWRMVESMDDEVSIEVFLEGDFPASIKHFQSEVKSLLEQFKGRNTNFKIRFLDPTGGSEEETKALLERFKNLKISPINLPISGKASQERKLIFPVAIIRYEERERVVRLLEQTDAIGIDYTRIEALSREMNLLEYKFATALHRLKLEAKPRIGLLSGHGEVQRPLTDEFEKALYEHYDIGRFNPDSLVQISPALDVLVIAKPRRELGERTLFKIDQYIMNGGKTLWLIDALDVEMDSIWGRKMYIPLERQLDVFNMLFKYGVRVNANSVLDWNCSPIPVMVSQGQMELRPWFYHVLGFPYLKPEETKAGQESQDVHPIVRHINYVDMRFPSSLDTVQTRTYVKKTPLLRSSRYSKVQYPPLRLSMDILDAGLTQEAFNKGYQNLAFLLEGEFESYFRNRVAPEMLEGLQGLGLTYQEQSIKPSRMIIVGDGDVASNHFEPRTRRSLPLGANPFNGQMYGNRDFLLNAVEYLLDTEGLISARSKQNIIRPLDQGRALEEELQWQLINLAVPLLILLSLGFAYFTWRKRRYVRD